MARVLAQRYVDEGFSIQEHFLAMGAGRATFHVFVMAGPKGDVVEVSMCDSVRKESACLFTTGSDLDNFTLVELCSEPKKQTCVETVVFGGAKILCASESLRFNPDLQLVGEAPFKLFDCMLTNESVAPLVKDYVLKDMCTTQPAEYIVRRDSIARMNFALNSLTTDPKLAKSLGRAIPKELLDPVYFNEKLGVPEMAVAMSRSAICLANVKAFFCLQRKACEEVSRFDKIWAIDVSPDKSKGKALNSFINNDADEKAFLLSHLYSIMKTGKATRKLGQANATAREFTMRALNCLHVPDSEAVAALQLCGWTAYAGDHFSNSVCKPAAKWRSSEDMDIADQLLKGKFSHFDVYCEMESIQESSAQLEVVDIK